METGWMGWTSKRGWTGVSSLSVRSGYQHSAMLIQSGVCGLKAHISSIIKDGKIEMEVC